MDNKILDNKYCPDCGYHLEPRVISLGGSAGFTRKVVGKVHICRVCENMWSDRELTTTAG